jgi:adenosylcobinamide-GDP ribazoletransferase
VNALRLAFGLLTAVPVGRLPRVDRRSAGRAVLLAPLAAVPLVVVVVEAHAAVAAGAPPLLLGAVVVTAGALLSRGMHLDGLADTADALLAGDREAAERARKDPAVGPGGATALVLALGAEVAALASLGGSGAGLAGVALVAVGAASRVVPLVATRLVPSSGDRDGAGLARWFARGTSTVDVSVALLSTIVVAAGASLVAGLLDGSAAGLAVAAGAGIGSGIGLGATLAIASMRERLDGDGMGASIEISMAVGLVATAALVA